jgi:hypothetical protein
MEIIIPAAGLSTRFPNMRPKYTLTDYSGKMMFEKAIAPYLNKHQITMGILKEHNDIYNTSKYIEDTYGDKIRVIILPNRTSGPADTVFQIIKKAGFTTEEILIKDCDSFFDYPTITGNGVCVSRIEDHDILRRVASKSFVITNDQGIITNIIEKQIVSNKFCVGGYKFESADLFVNNYQALLDADVKEIFVSHIIEECLNNNAVFKEFVVANYVDVGTAEEWFNYNDKAVIFCDIDGTLICAQGKHEYYDTPVPLKENISKIQELEKDGSVIIFTTARPDNVRDRTIEMLQGLGFEDIKLLTGLPNAKRILINDYNSANPFPRAIAINIKRDSDTLGDYL